MQTVETEVPAPLVQTLPMLGILHFERNALVHVADDAALEFALLARVVAYQDAVAVADFDRQRAVVLVGDVVGEHGAGWRVATLVGATSTTGPHQDGRLRREQVHGLVPEVLGGLADDREIVEDPEAAPLRRGDEVVLADGQVGDWHGRQVQVERLPVVAVVEGDEHAALGAGIQQSPPLGILAHDAYEVVLRQIVVDLVPVIAVIRHLVDVRPEVVHLVAGYRDVDRAGIVRAHLDRVDLRAAKILRRDVFPGPSAVARQLQ